MTESATCEVSDGIAVVTLNRPDAANAINANMRRQLAEIVDNIARTPEARVIVITGAGTRAFAAGSDVGELRGLSPKESLELSLGIMAFHERLASLPVPVIAAVRGWCLGGGFELALACDMRLAADDAQFGFPEVRLGIMPGGGGTVRLTRLAGPGIARELCLSGQFLDAKRAFDLGIVSSVVPPDTLEGKARELASRLAQLSGVALAQIKRTLALVEAADPVTAQRAEAQACAVCFSSADREEGMAAFLEKRAPVFRDC